jgi:hypothetical protein
MAGQIASTSQVKCVDTQKLFFGKFAYSFTVPFAQAELNGIKEHLAAYNWNASIKAKVKMQRGLLDRVFSFVDTPLDTEYRIFATGITFYTNEGEGFERLVKRHSKMMSKISRPRVHPAVLAEQDINVIVRDRLWFDQFSIKIVMNWLPSPAELDELVEEQFDDPETAYYNYGNQRVLYVKDMKKLIIAKLKLHNFIARVEKIKLIEEINDERATAAEAY